MAPDCSFTLKSLSFSVQECYLLVRHFIKFSMPVRFLMKMIVLISSLLILSSHFLANENTTSRPLMKLKYKVLGLSILFTLMQNIITDAIEDLDFDKKSSIAYDESISTENMEEISILCALIVIQHHLHCLQLRTIERAIEDSMNEGR